MSDPGRHEAGDPLERAYPPLDAADSRWWYWIVAYLVTSILFVPFVVVAVLAFLAPVVVVGPGGGPTVGAPRVLFLLFTLLVFGFAVLAFGVFVMLPVALYMDARQVARADLDWEPDPLLYGGLGLLQFFVTPVVGLVVALYYLYRRHEEVGVP